MAKRTYSEPSINAILNDRGNYLGNAQNYLHSAVAIAKRLEVSEANRVSDHDIFRLIELTDKCSSTLKKYLNTRNFMAKDGLIAKIGDELSNNPAYQDFDAEINWLDDRFGDPCVEICQRFIDNNGAENIQSIEILYSRIISFREQFRRVYSKADMRGDLNMCLNNVLKIAIGTALVCEDGLKYYKSTEFSARSIWLGSRMFLNGTGNLLQLDSTEEM